MIQKYGLYIIWVVSCLGTLASFYIEEPSLLDWYQRVCLFPFIFMTGMAAWRGFLDIAPYLIPQALVGFGCAVYQILLFEKKLGLAHFYSEPVSGLLWPALFASIFFLILLFSIFLSKKRSPEIFL